MPISQHSMGIRFQLKGVGGPAAGIELALEDPVERQLQGSFHCCICCEDHLLRSEPMFTVTMCGHCFCREGAQAMVLSAVRCAMLKLYAVLPHVSFRLPILQTK